MMLYDVKGLFVQIQDKMYPAGNIQIYDTLELFWEPTHGPGGWWYGVYFVMMFEDGFELTVEQTAPIYANAGLLDPDDERILECFRVDKIKSPKYNHVFHRWEVLGEDELIKVLDAEVASHTVGPLLCIA